MLKLHPEILNEAQKELLPFIKSFAREYYLVGGTAVSLQIGHRQSIDFDLFKKSPISKTKIVKRLAEFGLSYQQLCYFKNLDYSEEVFYLGNAAVSDETVKAFLTQIATSD